MTEGTAWLAEPRAIALGGYSLPRAHGTDGLAPVSRGGVLTLPRTRILGSALPAAVLETA
ncbi:hypothetical protein ABZT27_01665 [Streptomyces sp. NPDC005389]|uniref:hypothetical protein n=1 Tax=Streptomyces sp. NPDC005389 TaxID=3157040 RepID=UPI0033ACA4D8